MTFYVLNNGGDITYPLDRQPQEPDDYSRRTRDLYQSNFRFHYDGARNHVVSYFKGRVNTGTGSHLISNQFYAVYYGDGTEQDLLRALKERVESTFDSQGWQTSESDRDANSIYTNLTTVQPVELSVDEGMLLRMIDKDSSGGSDGNPPSNVGQNENYPDGPIQLGAPDYASALRVCKRLIEQVDNIKLTISSSGHESSHPPSDVVVIPGDTDEPGAPTRGTLDWLQRSDLNHRIREANNRLTKIIQEDGVRATDLAKAFEDRFADPSVPNINDFGVRIDTPERKATRESTLGTAAMLGGSVAGVVLAFSLAVYLGYVGRIVGALNSPITLSSWFLPGVDVGATVPSWPVLSACLSIIFFLGIGSHRLILVGKKIRGWLESESGSTTDSTASAAAKQTAKRLLYDLREIRNHAAIEAVGGVNSAIDRVFDVDNFSDDVLKVYDRSSYQRSVQFVGVTRFGLGLLGALFGLTFLVSVGALVSQAWTALHYALIVAALMVVAVRAVPLALGGIRSLVGLTHTASLPDWRQSIASVVVLLGAITAAQLGTVVWRSGQGLLYQFSVAFVAEGPGRFVPIPVGVELLIFTVVGFLFVALGFAASHTDEVFAPALVLLATITGTLSLWYMDVFTSWWAWAAGLVIGLMIGAVLVKMTIKLDVTPRRVISSVGVLCCALLAVVFVESQVAYQSPVVYRIPAGYFDLVGASFEGYAHPRSLFAVGRSGLFLMLTGLTGYVLYSMVVRIPTHVEVLVVGPEGSDPLSHVESLFHHFLTDLGINADPNDALSKVMQNNDTLDTMSGVEPVKFTTDEVTVWTPIAEKDIIGDKVFKKLANIEQLRGPDHLPDNGTSRTGSHVSAELATALAAADVLVLLFPADGAVTSKATDSTEHSQDPLPESRRYLRRYQKLLEQYLNDEQRVLGVVTGAGARLRTEGGHGSERMYEQATDWAFEGASDELRDTILERLDNSAEGTLLPIVETDEEMEIRREVEQFHR